MPDEQANILWDEMTDAESMRIPVRFTASSSGYAAMRCS